MNKKGFSSNQQIITMVLAIIFIALLLLFFLTAYNKVGEKKRQAIIANLESGMQGKLEGRK